MHAIGLQETYIIKRNTVNRTESTDIGHTQHWSSTSATTTSSQQVVLHSSRGQVPGSLRTVVAAVNLRSRRVQCPTPSLAAVSVGTTVTARIGETTLICQIFTVRCKLRVVAETPPYPTTPLTCASTVAKQFLSTKIAAHESRQHPVRAPVRSCLMPIPCDLFEKHV